MNVLFLCSRNRRRSPAAEDLFRGWHGVETASAGLADDAECPLDAEMVEWADLIFVMEPVHAARLKRRFSPLLRGRRVVCLGIPDDYERHDPALAALLLRRAGPHLERAAGRGGVRD